MAFVIGALFAAGMYSMLRRSLVKLIIGLIFLSTAGNLLIFVAGGLTPASPPLVQAKEEVAAASAADPLPQAMILTAIVIGFGVLAFTLVLIKRTFKTVGTDDIDDLMERHY